MYYLCGCKAKEVEEANDIKSGKNPEGVSPPRNDDNTIVNSLAEEEENKLASSKLR